jgi:hypothetical protein
MTLSVYYCSYFQLCLIFEGNIWSLPEWSSYRNELECLSLSITYTTPGAYPLVSTLGVGS